MTVALKPLSLAGVPRALEKAERYRLLNEPAEAESICRDVLSVDPQNQLALVTLVLSLADAFDVRASDGVRAVDAVLAQIADPYQRVYYRGVLRERWARALVKTGDPGAQALGWIHDAMRSYEEAQDLVRQDGNDDASLRFNACVRLIERAGLSHAPYDEDHLDAIDTGDTVPTRR